MSQQTLARHPPGAAMPASPEAPARRPDIACARDVAAIRAMIMRTARYLRQEYLLSGDIKRARSMGPILGLLERFGPLTPSEIAHYNLIRRQTVTRTLTQLGMTGMISLSPMPGDHRSRQVAITPHGRAVLRETRTNKNALLRDIAEQPARVVAAIHQTAVILARMFDCACRIFHQDKEAAGPAVPRLGHPAFPPDAPFVPPAPPLHRRATLRADDDRVDIAGYLRLMIVNVAHYLRLMTAGDPGATGGAALAQLERFGPLTPSELAWRECIQRPAATSLLAQFSAAGFIHIEQDGMDTRFRHVHITPQGRRHLADLRRQRERLLAALIAAACLSAADLRALRAGAHFLDKALVALDPHGVSD